MNCEYCQKEFTSKSNLNYHQKTAKYCIKLRKNEEKIKINNFTCEHCLNSFYRKGNLQKHLSICKGKKLIDFKNELEEKDKLISELKRQIQELKEGNLFSQYVNLSYENIYKILNENLNLEEMNQGQKGLAKVIAQKILSNENGKFLAIVEDRNKQIIRYKNVDGEFVKDIKGTFLVNSIASVVEEIAILRKKEFADIFKNNKNEKDENEDENEDEIEIEIESESENEDEIESENEDEDEQEKEMKIKIDQFLEKEAKQNGKSYLDVDLEEDLCIDTEEFEIKNKNFKTKLNTIFYHKLINGITDLQILRVNSSIFIEQLCNILPSKF